MYESFGANIVDGNKVEFTLFFPDAGKDPSQYVRGGLPRIRTITVRGNFHGLVGSQDWALDPAMRMELTDHPNGLLYRLRIDQELPEGYYQYKYFVEFESGTTRWVCDPCTKYGGPDDSENSAFVVGGNTAVGQPIANRLPLRDLVLYELMIDDFTGEYRGDRAPVDALRDRLDYLQDLGVNGIAFMPWTSWPGGDFSWGYDPFQLFAVEYTYVHSDADPADKLVKLKDLINDCHARGLHVLMDGVFNHVSAGVNPNRGFPYKWLYDDPNESPFLGPFGGSAFFDDLDFNNVCLQQFIRDVCVYWLDVFKVDGIRFDYSLGFFVRGDQQRGMTKLIADIRQYLAAAGQANVSLFIEHLTDNRYEAIADTNEMDADGCWLDPFMYKHFDYGRSGNIDGEILRILNANLDFAPGKVAVTYVENHDQTRYAAQIGGRQRWYKTQPGAIALMTAPGAPMVHNGQEFAEDYQLPGSGPERISPRPLRWQEKSSLGGDDVGRQLFALYRRLIRIRTDHPGLRSSNIVPFLFNDPAGYGAAFDRDVVIFRRFGPAEDGAAEEFVVVINYSDLDQTVDVPFPADGTWEDLLNGGSLAVSGGRLGAQRIGSNWGKIFFRKT